MVTQHTMTHSSWTSISPQVPDKLHADPLPLVSDRLLHVCLKTWYKAKIPCRKVNRYSAYADHIYINLVFTFWWSCGSSIVILRERIFPLASDCQLYNHCSFIPVISSPVTMIIARQSAAASPAFPPVSNESHGSQILGIIGSFTTCAFLAVIARLYVRAVMLKTVGYDDYFMVLAMVSLSNKRLDLLYSWYWIRSALSSSLSPLWCRWTSELESTSAIQISCQTSRLSSIGPTIMPGLSCLESPASKYR